MSTENLKEILDKLRVFQTNLSKDNEERRKCLKVINSKLEKLGELRRSYIDIKNNFNLSPNHSEEEFEKAKQYAYEICRIIIDIDDILKNRLLNCKTETMGEKFDLKTAVTLLPVMNGKEDVTKQLIDSIELYNELLDDSGKKLLTKYVLKTRLSENAKIRLKQDYSNNQLLVQDLKKFFLTNKAPTALSVQLNNAKQSNKSIEDFGKSIEQLFVDLTIAQSEGNEQNFEILQTVNEKIAINAFSNGLNNHDLRNIIKARNYSKLNEAIRAAKDESIQSNECRPVFHFNKNQKFRQNFGNQKNNYRNFSNQNFNFHKANNFNSRNFGKNFSYNQNNYGRNVNNQRQFTYNNNYNRSQGYNRGKSSNQVKNNYNKSYYMCNKSNNCNSGNASQQNASNEQMNFQNLTEPRQFFRS